jgi:hypothetical protein
MVGKMVFGLTTQLGLMMAQNAIAKAMQASAIAELGIKKAKKAASVTELSTESAIALAKVTGAEASTLGAATPLILGGIAAVMAGIGAYSMMNDGIISPTGGMVVSGPEGSIQLNKKDSIIAGTNLGGGGNSNQDSSALISAINGLRSDIKALASRPINTSVQIDGKELATMQGKYPNEAGDANGKVAYQMS